MNEQTQIIIMGRLGAKPELAYTQKQEAICKFNVAENKKDSEEPIWHRVVVFGKQAESCKVHLDKGNYVFIQGNQHEKEYKNAQGETKLSKEILARFVGFPNI